MPPLGGPRQPPQLEPDERPLERRFGDAFQGLIVLGLAGIFGLLINLSQDSAVIKSRIETISNNDESQDVEIKGIKADLEKLKIALQVERELRRSK